MGGITQYRQARTDGFPRSDQRQRIGVATADSPETTRTITKHLLQLCQKVAFAQRQPGLLSTCWMSPDQCHLLACQRQQGNRSLAGEALVGDAPMSSAHLDIGKQCYLIVRIGLAVDAQLLHQSRTATVCQRNKPRLQDFAVRELQPMTAGFGTDGFYTDRTVPLNGQLGQASMQHPPHPRIGDDIPQCRLTQFISVQSGDAQPASLADMDMPDGSSLLRHFLP